MKNQIESLAPDLVQETVQIFIFCHHLLSQNPHAKHKIRFSEDFLNCSFHQIHFLLHCTLIYTHIKNSITHKQNFGKAGHEKRLKPAVSKYWMLFSAKHTVIQREESNVFNLRPCSTLKEDITQIINCCHVYSLKITRLSFLLL